MSTSSAAGGLPLGIVVTSAESADVMHKGMATLKDQNHHSMEEAIQQILS